MVFINLVLKGMNKYPQVKRNGNVENTLLTWASPISYSFPETYVRFVLCGIYKLENIKTYSEPNS